MDNRKLRLTNRVCGSREILHLWRFRCIDCCFGWRCLNFKAMTLACRTRRNCSFSSSLELDHSLCYVCVWLSPTKRTARALRPSRQESQTAQRWPHGPDIDSSPQSCIVRAATLRVSARWSTSSLSLSQTFSSSLRMLRVCSTIVLLRVALSELQRSESLPAGPLHLSLSHTFSGSLRMLRVCSTTVLLRAATLRVRHFPPKPLEELHRCSLSVCDHFVRDSARVPLPFNTGYCCTRMFHECMPNVLTRCFTT